MGKDTFVRIKNIIKTNRTEDMVDLTVKDNENFILASGICVCNSAMLDLNVLRLADVLLFKEPSLLQSRFERKNLQDMFQKVGENFKDLDNRKNYSYVISDDFEGMVWNELPDFWNESISKSFSKK